MEKEKIVSIEDRIPKLKQARKKRPTGALYFTYLFFLLNSYHCLSSVTIKPCEINHCNWQFFLSRR